MSNIERAANVIAVARQDAQRIRDTKDHISPHIAQALADAGLLAPEPVEPHTTPAGDTAFLGNQLQTDLVCVWIQKLISGDHIALDACQGWGEEPAFLTPVEAREVAAALLAAAAWAEQQ